MSKNLTPRQLRRMEARRTRKQNLNEATKTGTNRTEINRANAQHSTGPKTMAGKAASSRNAVRHGLTGTFCVLPGEDQDAYLFLHTELMCEHDPMTATEELLVSDMVRHYWLTQRAMRLQEEIMTRDLNDPLVMKQLALFIRYQTTNQRAFHKCLADLQKLQKQRKFEEEAYDNGFVSQMAEAPRAAAAGKGTNDQRLMTQDTSSEHPSKRKTDG